MMIKKRPILKNLINDGTLKVEEFQNSTLRPVIKMQNDFLLKFFKYNLKKKNINFSELSLIEKKEKIHSILSKDNNFKRTIIGSILAHFTSEELEYYFENSNELNRRILQIIIQRLQDYLTS